MVLKVNDGPFVVDYDRHLWAWIALKMDFHRLGTPYATFQGFYRRGLALVNEM